MKKCDHIKDLILTDYIDGELDKNAAQVLESHLLDCVDCRAFFKEVKNNVGAPFQQISPEPVPAGLWDAIKEGIEYESQAAHNPLAGFIEKLKGLFVFPRLVPVLASFIVMFLAGSVTLNTIQLQQAKDKDQGEYLVALMSSPGSTIASEGNDGGTPIEHYFL